MTPYILILFLYAKPPAVLPDAYGTKALCREAGVEAVADVKAISSMAIATFICVKGGTHYAR